MSQYDKQRSQKQQHKIWRTQWKQQEQTAIHLLENPESYPGLASRLFSKKLLFYYYPAFSRYKSWALFQLKHEYWVRRVVWNRGCFLPAIGPSMQIAGCERICSSGVAADIFTKFESVFSQPFVQLNEIGIDGEIFGVTLSNRIQNDQNLSDHTTLSEGQSTAQSTIQWWSCSAESCEEISQSWHEAIARLEERLPYQRH